MAQKYVGTHKGYQDLPNDPPNEITAELYFPDRYKIEDLNILTGAEKNAANKVPPPEEITNFKIFTYFKVQNDKKELISEFYPSLELRLTYTNKAWTESKAEKFWQEKMRPRVYYLEKLKEGWADRWVEFPDMTVYASPPEDENSSGSLIISVANIPDPRIGGC